MITRTDSSGCEVTATIEPTPAVSWDGVGFVADRISWRHVLVDDVHYLDVSLFGDDDGETRLCELGAVSWPFGGALPELDGDASLPVEVVELLRLIGACT